MESIKTEDNFFKKTIRFILLPWLKIPGTIKWWFEGSRDWRYRIVALPTVIGLLMVLACAPMITGYPIVWAGMYWYDLHSVIYSQPVIPSVSDKGTAIVKTTIALEDEMLKNWQDNDLPFSPSKTWIIGTDSPRLFQLGILGVVRNVNEELREHLSRETTNDHKNIDVVSAYNRWAYTSDQWMFASTESVYKEGRDSLQRYLRELENGTQKITVTSYNLDRLLDKLSSTLSETGQLLEDAGKGKVPWYKIDDNYYRSQGTLYATVCILRGALIDFADVLKAKQATDLLARIVENVGSNREYLRDPIYVMNGELGFMASDSSQLGQLIQNTNRDIDKLRTSLQ